MTDIQDKVRRAWVGLQALRQNAASLGSIGMDLINEYHKALDHLKDAGFDVEEWRITRDLVITPRQTVMESNVVEYGSPCVSKNIFMAKLDAVILYFTVQGEKTQIGFAGPKR